MRKAAGAGRVPRRLGGLSPVSLASARGSACADRNSTASTRHNGRNIRPACGDAANSAIISGAFNAIRSCEPKAAACITAT